VLRVEKSLERGVELCVELMWRREELKSFNTVG
jgi:hypothetical protein